MPMILAGCGLTRIVTVSPDYGSRMTYSTTVTIPRTRTVTTTKVYAADHDISLYLDLQTVAAAFAQSATIEEFENLLNNSSYMLSNLDLNHDGYVDYLRVMETVEGHAHVFVIQAVLADNIYQDVATLVAEVQGVNNAYVQVIGSSYIYGPNYIIQPVYYATPAIYRHLYVPSYRPWRSPWYWGHFPSHYRRPAPLYLSHYQSYVSTFMRNHRFCHEFRYAPSCHYPDFDRVSRDFQRNDYGSKHPEQSFTVRTANIPLRSSASASPTQQTGQSMINARDIRESQKLSTVTTTSSTRPASRATTPRPSGTTTATVPSQTSRSASVPTQTGRSSSVTTQAGRSSSTSTARTSAPQTTVKSRVSSSGSSSTRTSTVSSSGTKSTVRRGAESSTSSRSASASRPTTGSGSTRR